jgi:hypothetical protein
MTLIHRVDEEAAKLAEWFGLSDREVNWVRSAKAGNDEDGYSEALLGIDEEGWFPLRIRASRFEADVIDNGFELPRDADDGRRDGLIEQETGLTNGHGESNQCEPTETDESSRSMG